MSLDIDDCLERGASHNRCDRDTSHRQPAGRRSIGRGNQRKSGSEAGLESAIIMSYKDG